MGFQCFNVRQVPWEVLKTSASGLGFQHLPRDLANVNAWKPMFDPYNTGRRLPVVTHILVTSKNHCELFRKYKISTLTSEVSCHLSLNSWSDKAAEGAWEIWKKKKKKKKKIFFFYFLISGKVSEYILSYT